MTALNWDAMPRLLQELCEGICMRYREEVFALDQPGRSRRWYCRGCYVGIWVDAGRPPQEATR
jgi:hypothetical protein